jgi:hypothetical protein
VFSVISVFIRTVAITAPNLCLCDISRCLLNLVPSGFPSMSFGSNHTSGVDGQDRNEVPLCCIDGKPITSNFY